MSEEFGRRACREFNAAIKQCYIDEFLCLPTVADIKSIIFINHNTTLMKCLGPSIAHIPTGKIV